MRNADVAIRIPTRGILRISETRVTTCEIDNMRAAGGTWTCMLEAVQKAALLLGETASAAELGMLMWRSSELRTQPRGNGAPVIVLPGFGTDDMATWLLRKYLLTLGYDVCGWRLGVNHGDVASLLPRVSELMRRCAFGAGRRVRLVGWSLGGTIAREIARDEPWLVERVVTLGSPVRLPKHPSARHCYSWFGHDLEALACQFDKRHGVPIRVPVTAIRARYDGFVSHEESLDSDPGVEQIEVSTTHLGLGMNADVYRIVAQRLATLIPRRTTVSAQGSISPHAGGGVPGIPEHDSAVAYASVAKENVRAAIGA